MHKHFDAWVIRKWRYSTAYLIPRFWAKINGVAPVQRMAVLAWRLVLIM